MTKSKIEFINFRMGYNRLTILFFRIDEQLGQCENNYEISVPVENNEFEELI